MKSICLSIFLLLAGGSALADWRDDLEKEYCAEKPAECREDKDNEKATSEADTDKGGVLETTRHVLKIIEGIVRAVRL